MLATRAADNLVVPRLRQPGRRPGRAGLRRPAHRLRRGGRAASRRGRGVRGGPARRRPRPRRRLPRAPARPAPAQGASSARRAPVDAASRSSAAARDAATGPRCRRVAPARSSRVAEEIYQALVLGTRDYVHKNGFATSCRAVRRHRLGARRGHRRRRARARERGRRHDAVALFLGGHAARRRAARREPRHRVHDVSDRAGAFEAYPPALAPAFKGLKPDGRGEPPGPHPRDTT